MSTPSSHNLLDARIKAVWSRHQKLHITAGFLALCRWAIPMFLVAILIDRPAYLPNVVRALILLAIVATALYKAWRCGWGKLEPFDSTRAALQLENHEGDLESLLVTAVQLRDTETSESMRDYIAQQAEKRVAPLSAEKTVPFHVLKKPAMLAGGVAVVLAIMAAVDGPFVTAGLQRIFTPWVMVEYPTDTQLVINDPDMVIKQGEEAHINIQLSGVIPEQAEISLKTGDGRPRVRSLDVSDGECAYTIASASRDFTYRVYAGDTRSDWHEVNVVQSPKIKKVKAVVHYPDYLEREPETVSGLTMTVPEDARIEWTLTMDSPLREAKLLSDSTEPMSLDLSKDGMQVTLSETAEQSRGYRFEWVEMDHGFDFKSPRHYLQVAPDQPPTVDLSEPDQNLVAIIGRAVNFKVRARDDHGFAGGEITYRVNLRPPEKITLTAGLKNGGGEQPLGWDYRTAVTNLQIGDTVAFSVEVRDRYAGEGGAHSARSDTRRITFLSKEDYLAEIAKRKGRLLSRVRGIYRQERAAHQLVLSMNTEDAGYEQSVQLESARQEMLRGQLHEAVDAVQELIDDLTANGVSDAPEGEMLDELNKSLKSIAEKRVAHAAELLRQQGNPLDNGGEHDVRPVAHAIDLAAREMGRLVLKRDIDSALEVFAREVRAIAENGAEFKSNAVTIDEESERLALVDGQKALAAWAETLLTDLENGMQYNRRPLGVLRLTREIKSLRAQGVAKSIGETAVLIEKDSINEAIEKQAESIHALLESESIVRRDVEYRTLSTARDRLYAIQAQAEQDPESLAELRDDLAGLLLPPIPAPRTRLFDDAPAGVPDVDSLMRGALSSMAKAESSKAASDQLAELLQIVGDRTEDALVETVGFGKVAATISEWGMRIADFETRQIGLLEDVDIAAVDKKPCAPIAAAQATMTQDMQRFKEDIRKDNRSIKLPDADLEPLLGRLDGVLDTMNKVLPSLRENKHDEAIELQDKAAYALTDLLVNMESQSERYSMLENLLGLERAVRKASRYVEDIASEQRDIIAIIEKTKEQDLPTLVPVQKNLGLCITEVAPLLDFVAGQLDVGTPLAFTSADIDDAVDSLGVKEPLDAIDALDAASESMEEVTGLILAMSRQVGYIAEVVDAINVTFGDVAYAAYEQEMLAKELSGDNAEITGTLEAHQAAVAGRVKGFEQHINLLVGSTTNMVVAFPLVNTAAQGLKSKDAATSHEQMKDASEALNTNASGLLALIEMLYGLPKLEVTKLTGEPHLRLLDVLAIAGDHHALLRSSQVAGDKKDDKRISQQAKLTTRCEKYATAENAHPKLVSAKKNLAQAAELLKTSPGAKAIAAQEAAGTDLRHFIVEQALALGTKVVPGPPADPDAPPSESGDASSDELAQSIGIVGGFVSGELPKNQRSEWEILKERTRAALHENFARELPLEYRGMLKSYFEGVAK